MAKPKKSFGVVLYSFGDIAYHRAAYNIAFSIKRFTPQIPIALFCDSEETVRKRIWNCQVFDQIIEFEKDRMFTGGKFDPGKVKVTMYDSLPFDHNLYLDCDAICVKDIWPLLTELIDSEKPYVSHTVGYHKIEQGTGVIPSMQWAKAGIVWDHWKLGKYAVLPAINSSLQYIRKCDEAKKIYDTAKDWYINKPLPLKSLNLKWGGGQPDELYMNATFALLGYDPAYNQDKANIGEGGYIHFAMRRGATYQEVIDQFYFQSYYGGRGFTAAYYIEWLDRLLYKWHFETRDDHQYRISEILKKKHANKK
jgi:hypothetical protein